MIPMRLAIMLLGCTVLMGLIMAVQMKWYSIPRWKSAILASVLIVTGLVGAMLLFYIENGEFGGRSLYGSIFLTPLVFLPASYLVKIKYTDVLDLCAPSICLTLSVIKVLCLVDGCCSGVVVYVNSQGENVQFPSAVVESIVFFSLMVVLLLLSKRLKYRGQIFPAFLVIYGIPRFGLSFLRLEHGAFALGLPAGAFWSVWAVLIGVVWLGLYHKFATKHQKYEDISIDESN